MRRCCLLSLALVLLCPLSAAAQRAPQPAPSTPFLVAGGIAGALVGLSPLVLIEPCTPDAEECLADAVRGAGAAVGVTLLIPTGTYLASGGQSRWLDSVLVAAAVAGLAWKLTDADLLTERQAYVAIPLGQLASSVALARWGKRQGAAGR